MPKTKYGDKTAKELDNYMKNYKIPQWPNYFGKMAPAIDFARNYATMHTKGLKESDQFFHCKANYEATTGAKQGEQTAQKLSNLRENFDRYIKGDDLQSSLKDQRSNARGRIGAKQGKSLRATCPTHHSKYK